MKGVSMRQAINNMCKSCIYDAVSASGTWKQQVEACTAKDCPLYVLRAKSSSKKDK